MSPAARRGREASKKRKAKKSRQLECPSVIHRNVVYSCSRCGGCYACSHTYLEDRKMWRCRDGVVRPLIMETHNWPFTGGTQ